MSLSLCLSLSLSLSHLCSTGKTRNAKEADVCYFSIILFLCLLSFWFRGFKFECDLDEERHTRCLQFVVGQESWRWATQFEKFTEGVECMMDMLGRILDQGWFYSRHNSGEGWDGGVKYCWNQYRSNFSLPNKFVIHSSL
jgi:hypothetical protein